MNSDILNDMSHHQDKVEVQVVVKLDPVGSTVRYEMMKLCTGSV